VAADGTKKDSDWVKYFCIVFGVLIAVVGVLFFKIRKERMEYEKANALAEQIVTGKGLARKVDRAGNPLVLPELTTQVFQYLQAYKDAVGDNKGGISASVMTVAATKAGMTGISESTVRSDPNRRGGYQTISRDFTYDVTTLDSLIRLMYNVEARPPLRVFDVRWQLQEPKLNSEAPRNRIQRPVIKVGVREPLARDDGR
jgi:hypothetical protein